MWDIVASCLTEKIQGVTAFDMAEYPLGGWSVIQPGSYRQKTRTKSGVKISNTYNPSQSIERSVGR